MRVPGSLFAICMFLWTCVSPPPCRFRAFIFLGSSRFFFLVWRVWPVCLFFPFFIAQSVWPSLSAGWVMSILLPDACPFRILFLPSLSCLYFSSLLPFYLPPIVSSCNGWPFICSTWISLDIPGSGVISSSILLASALFAVLQIPVDLYLIFLMFVTLLVFFTLLLLCPLFALEFRLWVSLDVDLERETSFAWDMAC